MELECLEFEIKHAEVVKPGKDWVYLWFDANHQVIKVGATWLHPAARAEKHLEEEKIPEATVRAYCVPQGLDRQVVKKRIIDLLGARNCLSDTVRSENNHDDPKENSPKDLPAAKPSEEQFAAMVLESLFPVG